MYAKLFTSIYQGTLRGNSHGLLVFTNLLAHCDKDGIADIHPRAIAEEVGLSVEQVRAALQVLEMPDEESRSPERQGRRIVRIDDHRSWGWLVVNYCKYRAIRNEDDRREQNRAAQERHRQRHQSKPPSAEVSQGQPHSAHTEAEAEANTKTPPNPRKRGNAAAAPPGFDAFWKAYPKKADKPAACRAFVKARIDEPTLPSLLAAIATQAQSKQWTKDDGEFIPNPATWLNARRWEDETTASPAAAATLFSGAI